MQHDLGFRGPIDFALMAPKTVPPTLGQSFRTDLGTDSGALGHRFRSIWRSDRSAGAA